MLYRLFRYGFYDRADHIVAPSPFAADLLRRHGVSQPISVVSNGIPEAFFDVTRLAEPSARWRVLSVGRLAREKHQQTLLQAVAHSRHRERIDLTLIGAGPLQDRLTAQARELGVEANVGPVDDATLLDHYRRADLFVHCGGVELEGMSVLEAMASGNTVLVANSSVSAAPALVDHPMARFQPGDPRGLSRLLDHWLDAPDARREAGIANRRRAAGYGHEHCVDGLLDVYSRVLQPGPALQAPAR
jgi:glycosyltransferase involved in cell wall biosynthesis